MADEYNDEYDGDYNDEMTIQDAVEHNDKESLTILLQRGERPTTSALEFAVRMDNYEITKILLENGAVPNEHLVAVSVGPLRRLLDLYYRDQPQGRDVFRTRISCDFDEMEPIFGQKSWRELQRGEANTDDVGCDNGDTIGTFPCDPIVIMYEERGIMHTFCYIRKTLMKAMLGKDRIYFAQGQAPDPRFPCYMIPIPRYILDHASLTSLMRRADCWAFYARYREKRPVFTASISNVGTIHGTEEQIYTLIPLPDYRLGTIIKLHELELLERLEPLSHQDALKEYEKIQVLRQREAVESNNEAIEHQNGRFKNDFNAAIDHMANKMRRNVPLNITITDERGEIVLKLRNSMWRISINNELVDTVDTEVAIEYLRHLEGVITITHGTDLLASKYQIDDANADQEWDDDAVSQGSHGSE